MEDQVYGFGSVVPKHIEACVLSFEDKVQGTKVCKKAARTAPRWPQTYIYYEKIPKYWKAEVLAIALGFLGVTKVMLDEIDDSSPTAINEMFDFLNSMHGKMKIPQSLREKDVMKETHLQHMQNIGRMTQEWVDALTMELERPCQLHWGAPGAGCFWFERSAYTLDKLLLHHCNGSAVCIIFYILFSFLKGIYCSVCLIMCIRSLYFGCGSKSVEKVEWPTYIVIDEEEIDLQDNYSDKAANILLGDGDVMKLAPKFSKNVGPNDAVYAKPIDALNSLGHKVCQDMRRKQKYEAGQQVETMNLVDSIEQRTLDRKRAQASSNFAKRAPKKKAKCVGSVVLRPDDEEPVAPLQDGDLEEQVGPAELDAALEERVDERG